MNSLISKVCRNFSIATLSTLVIAKMPQETDELRQKFDRLCKNAYNFTSALTSANVNQSDIDDLREKLKTHHDIVPKCIVDHQVSVKI